MTVLFRKDSERIGNHDSHADESNKLYKQTTTYIYWFRERNRKSSVTGHSLDLWHEWSLEHTVDKDFSVFWYFWNLTKYGYF